VILVNGDIKLSNGLELYLTPGHSLGSQSIVVPTEKGRYVIVGDMPDCLFIMFPTMDKLTTMEGKTVAITPYPPSPQRFIVGGFDTDHWQCYDSHYKQLLLAQKPEPEYIICSHEPSNIYRKFWG
jgi:glyoxylase-like metal-dependent hydrolase (beta-lactamase superfamily II)